MKISPFSSPVNHLVFPSCSAFDQPKHPPSVHCLCPLIGELLSAMHHSLVASFSSRPSPLLTKYAATLNPYAVQHVIYQHAEFSFDLTLPLYESVGVLVYC